MRVRIMDNRCKVLAIRSFVVKEQENKVTDCQILVDGV